MSRPETGVDHLRASARSTQDKQDGGNDPNNHPDPCRCSLRILPFLDALPVPQHVLLVHLGQVVLLAVPAPTLALALAVALALALALDLALALALALALVPRSRSRPSLSLSLSSLAVAPRSRPRLVLA